jgi:rhodanese-related sulfurtransferase
MLAPLDVPTLTALLGRFPAPEVLDLRTAQAVEQDRLVVPGALMRDPALLLDWSQQLERWREVVVYCKAGHERSLDAASSLCALGFRARALGGGFDAWRAAGGPTQPLRAPTAWVTRERPKVDRIACPWLVRRFIDTAAVFHFVPTSEVREFAARSGATAFDVPDVEYTHAGDACSFDAFIARHGLHEPALDRLAGIVRGADTDTLSLAPEASGLLAVSLGLSHVFDDDHEQLRAGLLVYDALYAWCRRAQGQTNAWNPAALRRAA